MNETKGQQNFPKTTATLSFQATDVTGTSTVSVEEMQGSLPASVVAESLASSMQLPESTPWALRDDATSRFLDDARSIGDQIEPGSSLTVVPKTHLG